MGKRKVRRVKYEPHLVALRVLNNPLHLAITRILLEANIPLQAGEIRKKLLELGIDISVGYVSNILKKLEKWHVARPYKNPANGRLLWVIKESKATELIAEELRKQETKLILETWGHRAMTIEHRIGATASESTTRLMKKLKELAKKYSNQYALYYYSHAEGKATLNQLYRAYCEATGRRIRLATLRKQLKILKERYKAVKKKEIIIHLYYLPKSYYK